MSKQKIEVQLEQLVELAKEWRTFSRENYGWETMEHPVNNSSVRCYFADNSEHTSIDFQIGTRSIDISFFEPVHIEAEITEFGKVPEYIKLFTAALDDLKKEAENTDKEVLEREKQQRIEVLEAELKNLKGES